MSFRGFNWTLPCSPRGCLSVVAAALVFLNPITCFTERLDEKAQQCCASRRCHTTPSRNKPDCCKIRLLSGGQPFLSVGKTVPQAPTLFPQSISETEFSPTPVLPAVPVAISRPREHSPPDLYTIFCSFLI